MRELLKCYSSQKALSTEHPSRGCPKLVLFSQLSRMKQCGLSVLLMGTTCRCRSSNRQPLCPNTYILTTRPICSKLQHIIWRSNHRYYLSFRRNYLSIPHSPLIHPLSIRIPLRGAYAPRLRSTDIDDLLYTRYGRWSVLQANVAVRTVVQVVVWTDGDVGGQYGRYI